jgi:uncharacterized membrane protein YdjX (TVP38/TMEM64 family)
MAGGARSGWIKVAAVLAVAAAAVAVTAVDAEAPSRAAAALRGGGPRSAALLAGAYILGALLFVPAPLLHLVTGFALGPLVGAAVALPAAAAGACAAFALGRWLVRERASRIAARTPALAGLDAALSESGFRVVLLLRLAPLSPFAVLNYLLGATPVRLRDFTLATVVGSVPGLLLEVYLGSLAGTADALMREARTGRGAGALLLATAASGAVMVALAWVLRRAAARATATVAGQRLG